MTILCQIFHLCDKIVTYCRVGDTNFVSKWISSRIYRMSPIQECKRHAESDLDITIPSFMFRDRVHSFMTARQLRRVRLTLPIGKPSRRGAAAMVLVAVVLSLIPLAQSGAAPQANTVATAQDHVARASRARLDAESRLAQAASRLEEQAAIASDLQNLSEDLTVQITAAKAELQEIMVAAYIDGGERDAYRSTLSPSGDPMTQWGLGLLEIQSEEARRSAARYADLKSSVDPEYVEAANILAELNAEYETAKNDAIQAAALERAAEKQLQEAQEAQRRREAEAARQRAQQVEQQRQAAAQKAAANRQADQRSAAQTTSRSTAPSRTTPVPHVAQEVRDESPKAAAPSGAQGSPTESERATLARIRACESGGNYSIVSASGRYRGAYQFDYQTWASMGGSGDPAAASPAEQDYRALLLLRQRGTRPWPVCAR